MNRFRGCLLLVSLWILCLPAAGRVQNEADERPAEKPPVSADAPAAVEGPPLSATARELLDRVNQRIRNIGTEELLSQLEQQPSTVVVDVRSPQEITLLGGRIDAPNQFNIMRGWLEFQIDSFVPDRGTPIVVYCGVNQRSPLAADTLTGLGYTNVSNYADGFFAWKRAGLPVALPDRALDSFLYSRPQEVITGVWSAIGATAPPSYDNSGHNNNLSFVITDDGVLVVNGGDNYLLAQSLHQEIRRITSQPVRYLVLENAQGHAMLGASYWKDQGVTVIAHADAAEIIAQRGEQILQSMQRRNRDKAFNTRVVLPDSTFDDKLVLEMGSERIELVNLGPAHSPGDISVWLPQRRLIITGDLAFHQRLLPVFEHTDTAAWIETWKALQALGAEYVIPGHGGPTDMAEVTRYTRDYLVYMRGQMKQLLESGGSLDEAYQVDQSAYSGLDTFFELSRRNAGRIFRAMEFE